MEFRPVKFLSFSEDLRGEDDGFRHGLPCGKLDLRSDQLHDRRGKCFRRFLRHIMSGARHHAMDAAAGEF